MSGAEKAAEATMDEVLASIRRLLAEEPAASPLPPPQRVGGPLNAPPSAHASSATGSVTSPAASGSASGHGSVTKTSQPQGMPAAASNPADSSKPVVRTAPFSIDDVLGLADDPATRTPEARGQSTSAPRTVAAVAPAAVKPASSSAEAQLPTAQSQPHPQTSDYSAAPATTAAPSWLFPKPATASAAPETKAEAPPVAVRVSEAKPIEVKPGTKTDLSEAKPHSVKVEPIKVDAPNPEIRPREPNSQEKRPTPDFSSVVPGRADSLASSPAATSSNAATKPSTTGPAPSPAQTAGGFVSPALPERSLPFASVRPADDAARERQQTLAERLVGQAISAKPVATSPLTGATEAASVKAASTQDAVKPSMQHPVREPVAAKDTKEVANPSASELTRPPVRTAEVTLESKPKANAVETASKPPEAPADVFARSNSAAIRPAPAIPAAPQQAAPSGVNAAGGAQSAARSTVTGVTNSTGPAGASPPITAPSSPPQPGSHAMSEQIRSMEDTVAELLRPMLRQWLDANMPRIVEKALRVELAASAKKTERPN